MQFAFTFLLQYWPDRGPHKERTGADWPGPQPVGAGRLSKIWTLSTLRGDVLHLVFSRKERTLCNRFGPPHLALARKWILHPSRASGPVKVGKPQAKGRGGRSFWLHSWGLSEGHPGTPAFSVVLLWEDHVACKCTDSGLASAPLGSHRTAQALPIMVDLDPSKTDRAPKQETPCELCRFLSWECPFAL